MVDTAKAQALLIDFLDTNTINSYFEEIYQVFIFIFLIYQQISQNLIKINNNKN